MLLSNNFTSTELVIRKKREHSINDKDTCDKFSGDTCSTQKPTLTFKEGPDVENEVVPLSLSDWWLVFFFFSTFLRNNLLIAFSFNCQGNKETPISS